MSLEQLKGLKLDSGARVNIVVGSAAPNRPATTDIKKPKLEETFTVEAGDSRAHAPKAPALGKTPFGQQHQQAATKFHAGPPSDGLRIPLPSQMNFGQVTTPLGLAPPQPQLAAFQQQPPTMQQYLSSSPPPSSASAPTSGIHIPMAIPPGAFSNTPVLLQQPAQALPPSLAAGFAAHLLVGGLNAQQQQPNPNQQHFSSSGNDGATRGRGSRGGGRASNRGGRGGGGRGGYRSDLPQPKNSSQHQQTNNSDPSSAQQHSEGSSPSSPTALDIPLGARRERPKIDEDLMTQLKSRYEQQEEHSDASGPPPGFLDVDDALKVIESNDVSFIVTDTGTGKSTLLPKLLMERGHKVVSSQPRRTATVNLAMRVAQLRNESLGVNVGYRVRGEHVGDENTRLMYMTSYTLFLWIVSHPNDLGYTHFIIDEFHERQPDVEVMLALLKLARLKLGHTFKIVLMSASAEVDQWRPYFEELSVGIYSTCKPRYPVYEYYLEEMCRLTGSYYSTYPVKPVVDSLTLKNALYITERTLEILARLGQPEHSILVFLPGRTVVEQMARFIQTKLGSLLEPIQWYRDVELDRIQAAFKRKSITRKKVYLATDIAEVSITLPDVVFIIDSGTTKKPRIDVKDRNSVAFPPLELLWESRSAVAQRKGRVGRVQQGFYFCMIPETHLPTLVEMEPQIANSRIDELSLHILQIASNPLAVFNLCRQNTKLECIQLSTNILVDNGCALPSSHSHAEKEAVEHPDAAPWRSMVMNEEVNQVLGGASFITTPKGKIAQRLPLSVSASFLVYNGLIFSLESIMIIAAAIASAGTPFYAFVGDQNREEKRNVIDKASRMMRDMSCGLPSDVVASVKLVLEYKQMTESGLSDKDEEQWCEAHCCSQIRLQTIVKLEQQIKEQLGQMVTFVDVQDTAILLREVEQKAKLISWLVAAAFTDHAIFVENSVAEAQRQKKAGTSIFLNFDALCDMNVSSCVEWKPNTVVLPLILQVRYNKLFGTFCVRTTPAEFNKIVLLQAYSIVYDPEPHVDPPPPGSNQPSLPYLIFGVELQHRKLMFRCTEQFAALVLQFRSGVGLRNRFERIALLEGVPINDDARFLEISQEKGLASVAPRVLGDKLATLFERLMTAQEYDSQCSPYHGFFQPKQVSVLFSNAESIAEFVMPPTTTLPPEALAKNTPDQQQTSSQSAVTSGPIYEEDDD